MCLDLGGLAGSEIQNSDSRLVYSYQYFLSVILGEKVIVHGEADLYEMLYNKDNDKMPPEFKGGFPGDVREGIYGFNKARAFDYSYGYLQYSSNFGEIIFSMEPLVWGNAKNTIILSNNVNPFPALIWTKTVGKSRFPFLHGSISGVNQDVLSSDDINYAATYNIGNINASEDIEVFKANDDQMIVDLVYNVRTYPKIFYISIQQYCSFRKLTTEG